MVIAGTRVPRTHGHPAHDVRAGPDFRRQKGLGLCQSHRRLRVHTGPETSISGRRASGPPSTAQSRRRRDGSGRWCSSTRPRRDRPRARRSPPASPSRPIGWRSMKAWRISSIDLPCAFACVGDALVERRRLDRARADRVAADALLDEIGGDRLGQPDDRRLRGAVDVAVGNAAHRGGARGDVDDRAAALLQHPRQEGARSCGAST